MNREDPLARIERIAAAQWRLEDELRRERERERRAPSRRAR